MNKQKQTTNNKNKEQKQEQKQTTNKFFLFIMVSLFPFSLNSFQGTVLLIADIVLILALLFMAIVIHSAKKEESWPPITAQCPDWWILDGSGNKTTCVNVKDLGVCKKQNVNKDQHQTMNFNTPLFSGANGSTPNCAKYKWATNCKVSWDGITYGVPNPCSV